MDTDAEPVWHACGRREAWRSRPSDHFDVATKRFFNPWKDTDKTLRDVVRWWAEGARRPWPRAVAYRSHPPPPDRLSRGEIAVTFVGHATALVRLGKLTLLTDPHFSSHAGAFGRLGAPRVRPPGLPIDALPPVDVVFVSHCHYDHLDLPSIARLQAEHDPAFVTGLGVKALLERGGARRVTELDWWDEMTVEGVSLAYTPAQHWSNRSPFDRRATLWGGLYARHSSGGTVYFVGDSGYAPCFAEIRTRLGPPDVALIPIGAYEPRWIMEDNHMNPDEAVRTHLDVGSRTSVAIHHGCFRLSDEGFDDPVRALEAARLERGVSDAAFRVLDAGETLVVRSAASAR